MLIYILFAMIVIFAIEGIQIKNKKIKKISQISILVIFYLIAGMSYKIHNDYFIYEDIYRKINFSNLKYINWEKGYVILNAIFNNFLEFYNFKSLIYLVNIFLIYKGLKKILIQEKVYLILGLMYLLFGQFYSMYLSAFRQSIAIAIFIYSLSYIINRKLISYTLSIILAFFFHKSAIILYPVYFIFSNKLKIKMKANIFLYVILNILVVIPQITRNIVLSFEKIVGLLKLGTLSESYLIKESNLEIKNIIFNIFLFILYEYLNSKKENYFINKILFCYLIIEILSKIIGVFYRVEIYFTVFYCIFIVELFFKCNKNIIFKLIRISLVLFLGLNYNLKLIIYDYKERGAYIPLHFTFERIYKNIRYQDTAEYKHLLERYESNNNLRELKEKNEKNYIRKEGV